MDLNDVAHRVLLPAFRAARIAAAARANCHVRVVSGDVAPRLVGRSYYWTTPSGKTVVRHPNAYRWPKLYWPSTRRVEVGEEWIERMLRAPSFGRCQEVRKCPR